MLRFSPKNTLYPNSKVSPMAAISRATQLCSVRTRTLASTFISVEPKVATLSALSCFNSVLRSLPNPSKRRLMSSNEPPSATA